MATTGDQSARNVSLRDYFQVIRRRKWLAIGVLVVFLVVSLAISCRSTREYRASALLTYTKPVDIASALDATTPYVSPMEVLRTLSSAAVLIDAPDMAQRVATDNGLSSPAQIGAAVTATAPANMNATLFLTISAVSTHPDRAAWAANAFARSWVAWRAQLQADSVNSSIAVIESKLKPFKTQQQKQDPSYYSLKSRLSDMLTFRSQLEADEYQIISSATTPVAPFKPRPKRALMVGLLLGLVFGLGSVLLAEQLDARVRDQEVVTNSLKLPVLGRLPEVSKEVADEGGLVVLREPNGPGAEAFRALRGTLDMMGVDRVGSILVTSCTQGEGKTSTVCNLAVALAMAGKRVVVVDADMRRPSVHTYFDLPNASGLSTVVAGGARLGEALQVVVVPNQETAVHGGVLQASTDPSASGRRIYVLTSGPLPPNPGEMVTSRHLEVVLAELVKGSDMVLVDAPPFTVVGDTASLAARTAGIMLVLKMGRVTKQMLKEAQDFLAPLPSRKLGMVLANVPLQPGRYKYYRQQAEEQKAPPVEAV